MTNGYTRRGWWIAATTAMLLGLQGNVDARHPPAGQAITVDRVGDFVRVRTPGQQVEISGDWRKRVTVSREGGDRLLVELGAREADGSIRVALGGDILFDLNSTVVRPAAGDTLGKIAQVIRERSRGEVYVVGHTDSVGADGYNQKLSEDRAAAVIAWLNLNEGIPASIMLGRGMGKSRPVADNTLPGGSDNPEGRAQNRRVEIFLATRDDVDLRRTVEMTRVNAGGSDAGAAPARAAAAATAPVRRELRPGTPVQCTGTRSVELDSVLIETSGIAIETSGTCRVVIRNSEIRSQDVAITASGMSQVEIVDSVVVGRTGSVGASGAAQVSARGTEFRGALVTSGLAKFDDRGGNRLP